jgi:hypothetical protein
VFIVIYTLIWLTASCTLGLFGLLCGRHPVFDSTGLPWVVHRSWAPDPAPIRRPPPAGSRGQQRGISSRVGRRRRAYAFMSSACVAATSAGVPTAALPKPR